MKIISCTLETTATPEAIWAAWSEVSRWHEWDSELLSAVLDGDFRLGATGRLTPKSGPTSTFVISQMNQGESYTFTTQLPLCRLHVRRFLAWRESSGSLHDRTLCFTHEVSFEGLSAVVFERLLGKRFQLALPSVMQALKNIAEQNNIVEQ